MARIPSFEILITDSKVLTDDKAFRRFVAMQLFFDQHNKNEPTEKIVRSADRLLSELLDYEPHNLPVSE